MVRVHSVGEVRDEEKEDRETAIAKGVSPVRQTLNFSVFCRHDSHSCNVKISDYWEINLE